MEKKGKATEQVNNDLRQKGRKNSRLGLLALRAAESESKVGGPCPSSEELASFIEQKNGGQAENKRMVNHIAHCEHCYEEWLFLTQELAKGKERGGRIIRIFSNPRYLAAIGSGLAAAASVVIFLSISTEQKMESRIAQDEFRGVQVEQVKEENKVVRQSPAVEQPRSRMKKNATAQLAVPGVSGDLSGESSKNKVLLQEGYVESTDGASLPKRLAAASAGKGEVQDLTGEVMSYEEYLQHLSDFCREEQSKDIDDRLLLNRGRKLLRTPGGISPYQAKQIETIVSVLEQGGRDLKAKCSALESILQKKKQH